MNEIIEYATRTPHNTNPAVLESIINQNMNVNRVLDLDKYGITEDLIGLLGKGGGVTGATDLAQFWVDAEEMNPDAIQFTMENVKIVCKNPVSVLEAGTGKLYGICFEVLIGDIDNLSKVSVILVSDWADDDLIPDGLIIQVAVQELTTQS